MRQLIISSLILILVACTGQANFGDAITEGEPTIIPTAIIPERRTFEVERGDIIYQQSYTGRVTPITRTALHFPYDGRVLETFASAGDDVQAGDILATLDTSTLEAELLDAQEALTIAQSLLDATENSIEFARQRAELYVELAQIALDLELLEASDPPDSAELLIIRQREIELELAQIDLDELDETINPELQFTVTRAQAEVDRIQGQIEQATLVAPFDGNLSNFSLDAGDPVIAFETIAVIADLSAMEVTDVLNNTELSELSEGMPVVLQVAGSPGEVYDATIVSLPTPYGNSPDESIHIRFDADISGDDLSSGTRMSFAVTIAERQAVLWLPPSAIRQFNGRQFVVVQDGAAQLRVDIQTGLEGDNRVEILDGLEEDQVVIAP